MNKNVTLVGVMLGFSLVVIVEAGPKGKRKSVRDTPTEIASFVEGEVDRIDKLCNPINPLSSPVNLNQPFPDAHATNTAKDSSPDEHPSQAEQDKQPALPSASKPEEASYFSTATAWINGHKIETGCIVIAVGAGCFIVYDLWIRDHSASVLRKWYFSNRDVLWLLPKRKS